MRDQPGQASSTGRQNVYVYVHARILDAGAEPCPAICKECRSGVGIGAVRHNIYISIISECGTFQLPEELLLPPAAKYDGVQLALERGTWRRSLAVDLVLTGPLRGSMIPFPQSPHGTRDAVVCRRPLPETHSWLVRMRPPSCPLSIGTARPKACGIGGAAQAARNAGRHSHMCQWGTSTGTAAPLPTDCS